MIANCRANSKLTLYFCHVILAGLVAWLSVVLLSQLSLMEPVTAAAAQSLAGQDSAPAVAASVAKAKAVAETEAATIYAGARLWVWFCIGANSAGALLFGLWLRAAMNLPARPARHLPAALPAPRTPLIERAMQDGGAKACTRVAGVPGRPLPPATGIGACPGEASERLARIARLIDTLAIQTTLLAVNAAVEAERGSRMPPRA